MTYLVALFNLCFFVALGFWFREKGELKVFYWPALLAKLAGGLAVGLVYFYYYQVGDTIMYYEDARLLAHTARYDVTRYARFIWDENADPELYHQLSSQEFRAVFMVKIASVFSLASFDDYWTISIYFSFLSFFGSWFLIRVILRVFPEIIGGALLSILFFPSIVFWSSGVIKESLSMACLFFLTAMFLKIWFRERIRTGEVVLMIITAWILWNLKYYYAAVFFLIILTSLFYKFVLPGNITRHSLIVKALCWFIIFLIPLSLALRLHPNFRPNRILDVIVENYVAFVHVSAKEDVVHYSNLTASPGSIFVNSPKALLAGLFRPFPWEVHTVFQGLISFENTFVLILFAIAAFRVRSFYLSKHSLLIFSALMYVASLAVLIALSTPNFGTLSRYRVSYLPIFIMVISSAPPVSGFLQRTYHRLVRYKR